MKRTINRVILASICVLLSVTLLFQNVSAAEVEITTEAVVTDTFMDETSPSEDFKEKYDDDTPKGKAYEPDSRDDSF